MSDPETGAFPEALREVCGVELSFDFEPFDAFLDADDTTTWLRHWTGNEEVTGDDFRVFGMDGTGGYAAFWLVRPRAEVTEQPVVFLGSEGETGVVAANMDALLWLMAAGRGPYEAAVSGEDTAAPHSGVAEIAARHAPGTGPRDPEAITEEAQAEFPHFGAVMDALCC
ncbi:SMI1/KNR4 family protein [Streptomyces sp. NPDC048172]|uniref:SMI1/KNR4 family protein n=1 Tax=Streptomyces sp. NPDC048172 TaxID=3365505 RepID=UPI00371D9C9D